MSDTPQTDILKELILNWKLRLVVSALFSIIGFAVLIATVSGYLMPEFETLDQTIVGVAIFVIVTPVYLIVANLPNIDERAITEILSESAPELGDDTALILRQEEELDGNEIAHRRQILNLLEDENAYRFLPNRPIHQALIIMGSCLLLTAGFHIYL